MEGVILACLPLMIGIRMTGWFVCQTQAVILNRNQFKWSIIGFVIPVIAMIWIHCLKPVTNWEENN